MSDSETSGQRCKPSVRSITGKALKGHTYKAVTVNRPFECVVLCENDHKCRSFNFFLPEKICEMNSKTKEEEPQDFVKDDLRFYMKGESKINGKINKLTLTITKFLSKAIIMVLLSNGLRHGDHSRVFLVQTTLKLMLGD